MPHTWLFYLLRRPEVLAQKCSCRRNTHADRRWVDCVLKEVGVLPALEATSGSLPRQGPEQPQLPGSG